MKHLNYISSGLQPVAKLMAVLGILLVALTGCGHKPTQVEKAQTYLSAHKQEWFDRFHPIGTAKSVTVHDVAITNGPNGTQAVIRFTLYWEGPITKDGFTKIRAVHDKESNRIVRAEILETNGTTNRQAVENVAAFVGGFLSE